MKTDLISHMPKTQNSYKYCTILPAPIGPNPRSPLTRALRSFRVTRINHLCQHLYVATKATCSPGRGAPVVSPGHIASHLPVSLSLSILFLSSVIPILSFTFAIPIMTSANSTLDRKTLKTNSLSPKQAI